VTREGTAAPLPEFPAGEMRSSERGLARQALKHWRHYLKVDWRLDQV
jgi:hypothetical protein